MIAIKAIVYLHLPPQRAVICKFSRRNQWGQIHWAGFDRSLDIMAVGEAGTSLYMMGPPLSILTGFMILLFQIKSKGGEGRRGI